MFSTDIVSSDPFLDMGQGAQVLYFHLAMRADDDGFVNPKSIMRMLGIADDELKVLLAKRFILPFESGVVVIKHWLVHNLIRSDLYKETQYKKEKATLGLNENGAYTELRDGVAEIKRIESPEWLKRRRNEQRTDNVPLSARRIGKDRIGKDREDTVDESFEEFWNLYPKRRKSGKTIPKEKWDKLTDSQRKLVMEDIRKRPLEHWDWIKQNNDFVPAPEVYLNSKKEYWLQPIVKQQENKQLAPVQKVDRFVKK